MNAQWQRDEQVMFDDCVFANADIEDELRDYLSPATTDNLLLWGLPGTGKSTVTKAIAYERYGTVELTENGVEILNCKDKEQAKKLKSDWLKNWYNFAHFYSNCPVLILDEIDELTDGQQRELTAFVDFSNGGSLRSMVLATTNVDLRNTNLRKKSFSDALLSRFNTRLEMRQQSPEGLLRLAQKKLSNAGVIRSDNDVLVALTQHCDATSQTLDIRTAQTFVNKLIRRSQAAKKPPKAKPNLKLV